MFEIMRVALQNEISQRSIIKPVGDVNEKFVEVSKSHVER